MRDSHFSEMRWYSEISTTAFCESLDLVCFLSCLIWEVLYANFVFRSDLKRAEQSSEH